MLPPGGFDFFAFARCRSSLWEQHFAVFFPASTSWASSSASRGLSPNEKVSRLRQSSICSRAAVSHLAGHAFKSWLHPGVPRRMRQFRAPRCAVLHNARSGPALQRIEACRLENVAVSRSIYSTFRTGSRSPQKTRVGTSIGGRSGTSPFQTKRRAARFPRYQLKPPCRLPGFMKLSTKLSRSLSKTWASAAQ